MKLLMGYDGSECARAAIEDLNLAGLGDDVEARVVSVADVFPHLTSEFFEDGHEPLHATSHLVRQAKALARQALTDAKTSASEGAERVRKQFPKWKVEAHAIGDSPYWALTKDATDWKADLVVVGTHGKGALTRALIGGVSSQTIAYAPCSVRIGRCKTGRDDRPPQLLIGNDFSQDAAIAIEKVLQRKWPAGTKVTLMTVLDQQMATALPMLEHFPADLDEEEGIEHQQEATLNRFTDMGMDAHCKVIRGNPRKLLLEEAKEPEIDCIFVGARGLSRIQRIFLGSVSTWIAHNAPCSVEVAR
jgi:nucleotide-binding universal stress UspA family protein